MDVLSPYLIAIGASWLTAHALKYVIDTKRNKRLDFTHQLFVSGGMPSSHTATSLSVWLLILLKDGAGSGLFGLATLFVLIIGYDAVKVRRSVGEQGEAIQALIKASNQEVKVPRAAKGHTPLEVLAGAALGLLIGFVVFIATK